MAGNFRLWFILRYSRIRLVAPKTPRIVWIIGIKSIITDLNRLQVIQKMVAYLHCISTETLFSDIPVPIIFDNSQVYSPLSNRIALFTSSVVWSGVPPSYRDWFKFNGSPFRSHRTDSNKLGFASYSQNRRKSSVSFIVILSCLTVTTGGSGNKWTCL